MAMSTREKKMQLNFSKGPQREVCVAYKYAEGFHTCSYTYQREPRQSIGISNKFEGSEEGFQRMLTYVKEHLIWSKFKVDNLIGKKEAKGFFPSARYDGGDEFDDEGNLTKAAEPLNGGDYSDFL